MFDTKKKLKYAVIKWAMSTQRVFRTHISNPTNYTVKCVETGCSAKVHGHVPKYNIHWVVTNVVPHNCVRKKPVGSSSKPDFNSHCATHVY
uniref:Uncharacterized protein n=1 Tax=Aegilops tauschii subsp. strangulata TaxID=200361 RepID=A0A453IXF2_AEGTS